MIRHTLYAFRISCGVFFIALLAACAPTLRPAPFIPPAGVDAATATPLAPAYTAPPQPTALAATPTTQAQSRPTEIGDCVPVLSFVEDLTLPDGTVVSPGSSIEKIWRVRNDGNCNWDSRYRLKLVDGYELGAPTEQALFPARSGAEAEIHIIFTVPAETGEYRSAWQAYDPDGNPFGDTIYLDVIVQ